MPLRRVRVVEGELLLPPAVVASGHRHGLPVSALHQFKLALVHRLADRVVDKALGKRLFRRGNNLRKRHRHGSRYL